MRPYRRLAPRQASAPSRHHCPSSKPVASQREQGMPGVWLARSLVRKNGKHTSKYTTGRPKRSGIPCAMALRLIPRSLRRSGFLVTVPGAMRSIIARFTPASGRQDHAALSSETAHSSGAPSAAIASPSPTSVTIAIRPSWWARDARSDGSDLPDVTSEMACDTMARRANQLHACECCQADSRQEMQFLSAWASVDEWFLRTPASR